MILVIKKYKPKQKNTSPAIHTPSLLKGFGTFIHPRPKSGHSLYLLFWNMRNLVVKSISALLRALIIVFIQCYSKQPLRGLWLLSNAPVSDHHYTTCYFRAQIHWNAADSVIFQSKPILIFWPTEKSTCKFCFLSPNFM